jgi:hypothetical protein
MLKALEKRLFSHSSQHTKERRYTHMSLKKDEMCLLKVSEREKIDEYIFVEKMKK